MRDHVNLIQVSNIANRCILAGIIDEVMQQQPNRIPKYSSRLRLLLGHSTSCTDCTASDLPSSASSHTDVLVSYASVTSGHVHHTSVEAQRFSKLSIPYHSWYTCALNPIVHLYRNIAFSCSDQAIEQRPSKNESTQPPKHIAQPQITQRPVKVCAGLAICLERK